MDGQKKRKDGAEGENKKEMLQNMFSDMWTCSPVGDQVRLMHTHAPAHTHVPTYLTQYDYVLLAMAISGNYLLVPLKLCSDS